MNAKRAWNREWYIYIYDIYDIHDLLFSYLRYSWITILKSIGSILIKNLQTTPNPSSPLPSKMGKRNCPKVCTHRQKN